MPDQTDIASRPIERTDKRLRTGDTMRLEAPGSVTDSAEPLLAAKFAVPSAPRFMVFRRRLTDRLTAGLAGPVTVVTGPAGTGKTEMVASWARAASAGTVVWITLDEADSPAPAFWSYVIEGLHHAGVALSGAIGNPVSGPAGADRSFLIRLAADLADQPQPIVRVLDETNAEEAMRSPEAFRARAREPVNTQAGELTLELRPYAIARIESA